MIRTVSVLLFVFLVKGSFALPQKVVKASFVFSKYSVLNNAQTIEFAAKISFANNRQAFYQAGDSTAKRYTVNIRFIEGTNTVYSNVGYVGLTNTRGEVVYTKDIDLNLNDYSFNATLPLALFNLPEGDHALVPVITVIEKGTTTPLDTARYIMPIALKMPPLQKVKVSVSSFRVDSLDGRNEYWDYYFLNPRDAEPDLRWAVYYGGQTCHVSPVSYNTFVYLSTGNDTCTLTIAKGDHLLLQVRDWDQLSFDDIIGKMDVNPALAEYANNNFVTKKMSKVKSITYGIQLQ